MTTALGAAYAARLATGFWSSLDKLSDNWLLDQTWEAKMDALKGEGCYGLWKKAVSKTLDWV
jgi:glycerol kinase